MVPLPRRRLPETGMTMIELLIVIAILPLVIGAIGIALVSSYKVNTAVRPRLSDSHDAQLTSAYFARDVQSATEITTSTTPVCTTTGSPTPLLGLEWPATNGTQTNAVEYVTQAIGTTRTVTDGVTSSSTTITSATASFAATDVGSIVSSPLIPTGSFITSVTSATKAVLSIAATGTASHQTFVIGGHFVLERVSCLVSGLPLPGPPPSSAPLTTGPPSTVSHGLGQYRTVTNGSTTSGSATMTATSGFSSIDVGSYVVSPDVPAGTSVSSITDTTTAVLSGAATATETGLTVALAPTVAAVQCNGFYDAICSTDAAAGLISILDISTAQIFVSNGSPQRLSFTLTASPRLTEFSSGGGISGTVPPLELLGPGADCSAGNGSVTVYGTAAVNSSAAGSLQFHNGTLKAQDVYSQNPNTSGSNVAVSPPGDYSGTYVQGPPLSNPYRTLPEPATSGPNVYTYNGTSWSPPLPSSQPHTLSTFVFTSGTSPGSGPLVATDHGKLYSGMYVFNGGLAGIASDPGGVFLYDTASGSITISGNGAMNISALTAPATNPPYTTSYATPYTGLAFFGPNITGITMSGNGTTDALDGLVVVPEATVTLSGNGHTDVLGLIASSVACNGNGSGVFGPQPVSDHLTSSANPSQLGQNVTFSADVNETQGSNTPTGIVTFEATPSGSQTPTVLCNTVPLNNGMATCSTTTLVPSGAPYTIEADYISDNGADQNAVYTLTQYVPYATYTSVSGPGTIVSGQTAVLNASVTASGATPIGTVTFKATANGLGTPQTLCSNVALSGTSAQCSTQALLAAGSSYTVMASFTPTSTNNFDPSWGTASQIVDPAGTATARASSANPSTYGQTVTYTATVTVNAPGSGTPTGSVTFKDGGSTISCLGGSSTFNGTTATCKARYTGVATHSITATYGGDNSYSASGSSALTQTVNKSRTTTRIRSSGNPTKSGNPVTFTVTVSASGGGSGTPAGTVTIIAVPADGSGNITVCANHALAMNGTATCATSALVKGSTSPYTVTAVFTDTDGFFLTSRGTMSQAMN